MLSHLTIENVAVIERADIDFGPDLTVLTGETGAGKSIIIDSVNFILGERTKKQIIRTGAEKARVSAVFDNVSESCAGLLALYDIDCDGSLFVTRTLSSDGRTVCRLNGETVTVSVLRTVMGEIIGICGQHDSQKLLRKENHIGYIDDMAGLQEKIESYRELYDTYRTKHRQLKKLTENRQDRLQRLDFLDFQIEEISAAHPQPGETESLQAERKRLRDKEKIRSSLYAAQALLNGDGDSAGLLDMIDRLVEELGFLRQYDDQFSHCFDAAETFRYETDDMRSAVFDSIESLDEESDMESVEQRLDVLSRLQKKYGESEEEILAYLSEAVKEKSELESDDDNIEILEEELDELKIKLFEKAEEISNLRKEHGRIFEKAVIEQLRYLDMTGAAFSVDFTSTKLTANGMDEAEFLFSANSGQAMRSLSSIASGGELSRVMLAIRIVLDRHESTDTLIFDEIDSGVSGRAASKIALKLREMSASRQVICVTHLSQIAAAADRHLLISKEVREGNTYTSVTHLTGDDRIEEISRIIGGDNITAATRLSASEMINYTERKNDNNEYL